MAKTGPKGLDQRAQDILLAYLKCGLPYRAISRAIKLNVLTIRKYRDRFVGEGKLAAGEKTPEEKLRFAYQEIERFRNTYPYDDAQRLSQAVFGPLLEQYRAEVRHWAHLFEPQDPHERLWQACVDQPTIEETVDRSFWQALEQGIFNPEAIRREIGKQFRDGSGLPCWPMRKEILDKVLAQLGERTREIITASYGLDGGKPKKAEVAAKQLRLPLSRYNYHKSKAIETLRRSFRAKSTTWAGVVMDYHRSKRLANELIEECNTLNDRITTLRRALLEPEKAAADIQAEVDREKVLATRISDLDFSPRTYNCLLRDNIETLGDLVRRTENDLMMIRSFGRKSLQEVTDKLQQFSLELAKKPDEGLLDDDETLSGLEFDDEEDFTL